MAFLLELKESFKKFYNRYNTYVVPASKFIIALICFIMINTEDTSEALQTIPVMQIPEQLHTTV